MILNPKYRFMLKHEITLRASYSRGEPLPLISDDDTLDVLTILQEACHADTARMTLRNQDVVRLTHVDLREAEGVLALLFRRSDPDATAQMYENQNTGALRRSDKTADDAVTVSTHLFVKIDSVDAAGQRFQAVLEEVPGIGRTYVLAILLDAVKARTYEYLDHRGEAKVTHSLVDMDGVKGERVGDAAVDSTIEYIELVRTANTEGLDTEGVVAKTERMQVRLEPDADDRLGIVRRVKEWALGRDWEDVKVRLKMPDDKSRLVSVAREADAADVLFVRAVRADVARPLDACTDEVNEELLAKALEMFEQG